MAEMGIEPTTHEPADSSLVGDWRGGERKGYGGFSHFSFSFLTMVFLYTVMNVFVSKDLSTANEIFYI